MAPAKQLMPLLRNQISNLKRLGHGPLSTKVILDQINPNEMEVSYCYMRKIRSRMRHGYFDRLQKKRLNNHLRIVTSTIASHIIETTVRYQGLNSCTMGKIILILILFDFIIFFLLRIFLKNLLLKLISFISIYIIINGYYNISNTKYC